MRHAAFVGEKRDLKERYCMKTMHRWEKSIKMDLREMS
jgi:hypothetical protein